MAVAVVALVMIGFGASRAAANESIVGLWQITLKDSGGNFIDSVFSGWTSDGLEFDQDIVPILNGECLLWNVDKAGRSQLRSDPSLLRVTVANDGNSFTGKENFTFEVPGTNPYAGGGTTFTGFRISATKITVDKSLLP